MTPEEQEWQAAAKAGRKQAFGRSARVALVIAITGIAAILGALPGFAFANSMREDRIARYERGEGVWMPRGHSVYEYGASFFVLPLIGGVACGGIVLALGMFFVAKDRTYVRGLATVVRE